MGSAPSVLHEINGMPAPARFRYNRQRFQRDLLIAIAMTLLTCGLVWMLLTVAGIYLKPAITIIAMLSFFAFISAPSVLRYVRNDVVLAVLPTGLFDRRISQGTIPWDRVRDIVASPRENDVILKYVFWPEPTSENVADIRSQEYQVSIAELEGNVDNIIQSISNYQQVRYVFDSDANAGH